MADTKKQQEQEPKQTLPVGHGQAGYVSPDLSYHEGTGTIPESEAEWHEKRNEARDEEVQAVEEREDKVATEEAKEREKQQKDREKEQKDAKEKEKQQGAPSSAGARS